METISGTLDCPHLCEMRKGKKPEGKVSMWLRYFGTGMTWLGLICAALTAWVSVGSAFIDGEKGRAKKLCRAAVCAVITVALAAAIRCLYE